MLLARKSERISAVKVRGKGADLVTPWIFGISPGSRIAYETWEWIVFGFVGRDGQTYSAKCCPDVECNDQRADGATVRLSSVRRLLHNIQQIAREKGIRTRGRVRNYYWQRGWRMARQVARIRTKNGEIPKVRTKVARKPEPSSDKIMVYLFRAFSRTCISNQIRQRVNKRRRVANFTGVKSQYTCD